LIAALGSYLQARANQGIWRVRIEDIDPPREVPGAADTILRQLDHYGLHWDGEVLWQSQRHEAYREALAWLGEQGLSYYCTCTRARIHAVGGIYDGHCRDLGLGAENAALRLRQTRPVLQFTTVCAARSSPMSRWRVRILLSTVATACLPTTWRWWSTTFRGSPKLSAART
jgi:glutamyl-Q tRNA(Asp) synthetase